jgi:hypothetical protein
MLEKCPHAGHVARHLEILAELRDRRAAREVLLERAAAVADRSQDWRAVAEAIEAPVGRRTGQSTEPTNAADLLQRHPTNRPALIEGLLRSGEVASVICSAKAGKSWLLGQLALSVAAGADWLGLATRRGRVLLLDLELHPENLAFRIRSLHREMGLRPEVLESVDAIALRGSDLAVDDLARMADRWKGYSLIVLDPLYRAVGERDENANSDMAKVFNLVDAAAAASGAAWLICHHASKGSQTLKSVTDVGSGAGSISRASDCHLILRPHAVPGVAVVEAAVRSFPPLPAFCASFTWPLWQRASGDLDPDDLAGRPPSAGAKVVAARKDLADDADAIERFLDSQPGPVHLGKIVAGVCLAGRQIHDKRAKAGIERLILEDRVSSRLIPAGANGRRVPGFWNCEKFAKADEDDKQKQTDGGLFPVVSGCSSPAQADEDEQTETAPLGGGSVCLSVRCAAEDCEHTEGTAKRKRTRRKSNSTRPRNRLDADSESDFEPWPSETEARDIARPKKRPKSKRTSQAKPPVWSVSNE